MCGIAVKSTEFSIQERIMISSRGPDHTNSGYLDHSKCYYIASVLHINGYMTQPLKNMQDVLVLYNGEAFDITEQDTLYVNRLALDCIKGDKFDYRGFYTALNRVECEYSIIVVYGTNIVFFKDQVGRRSLGFSLKNGDFFIGSVFFAEECESFLYYTYDITRNNLSVSLKNEMSLLFSPLRLEVLLFCSLSMRLEQHVKCIAFSGGIDSMLLAVYMSIVLPLDTPIILINTFFCDKAYDRLQSYENYKSLAKRFPARVLHYIENSISSQALEFYRPVILSLIKPSSTTMDFNIGATLFFTSLQASSFSDIIFTGAGADELFCGYRYHHHMSASSLKSKVSDDLRNLTVRNIGRDDRVISHWGVETRYLFIDTGVIRYVLSLDFMSFAKFNGKASIRKILNDFGFLDESALRKVAMQAGSGIRVFEKSHR